MTDATRVDHTDPGFVAQPYDVFRALRERGPVHEHPGWGVRIAVSHAACSSVLRQRNFGRIWEDFQPAGDFPAVNSLHRFSMLESEQDHDRLRAAVAPLFQRRHVRRVQGVVAQLVDRYVRAFSARVHEDGSADLMQHLARPLPVDVIATLLDFPRYDRDLLRSWSNRIVTIYEPTTSIETRRDAERAARELHSYVGGLIDSRRVRPGQDLLSELVMALNGVDAPLSERELIANYVLLLMAGHEASVNGIGNAVAALSAHPAQRRLLCDDHPRVRQPGHHDR